jgi:ADP-heptose:LPS heptosyltransferase
MTTIAVVRALHLGDLLCAVPALRALRARYPRARVTLIGLPWANELVSLLPRYVDAFEEFPGFPGIPERDVDARRTTRFLADMQARHFDLAVQLHGSGAHINEFTALLGAERMVAFDDSGARDSDDATFVDWPSTGTEVARLLALPRALGWPETGTELELELHDVHRAVLERSAPEIVGRRYICLHPGARFPSRRWSADAFAAVADGLAERGVTVAITGTFGERAITSAVRERMRTPSLDLTGRLSLGGFAAAVRDATLLVSNDTGASHVAAAVGTKSVIVASGSDVARWAPEDARRHRVLWHATPCRPCMHEICPTQHECAAGVTPASVLQAVDELLAGDLAHA